MGGFRIVLTVLVCAGAAAAVRAQSAVHVLAPATQPTLRALVRQLADPRYSVREQASEQLAGRSYDELGEMVRLWRAETQVETKLRLRYAIENIYYNRLMEGEVGFLGITPKPLAAVYDSQNGQVVPAMIIEHVMADTAAARAKLLPNDIILDFDDQPIANSMVEPANLPPRNGLLNRERRSDSANRQDPESHAFTSHVKYRAPGTRIRMGVLRSGEVRRLAVTTKGDPAALLGTDVFVPTVAGTNMAVGGLAVKQVPEGSWLSEAKLQPGDVLTSMAGLSVPAGIGVKQFGVMLQQGRGLGVVPVEIYSTKLVTVEVTLGTRSPKLMNPGDWEDARDSFANWWRETAGEASFEPNQYLSWYGGMFVRPASVRPAAEVIP